jgi:hypothetical protein
MPFWIPHGILMRNMKISEKANPSAVGWPAMPVCSH